MGPVKIAVKEAKQSTESQENESDNLKEDIKTLWQNFFLETSLHGCRPIPKSQFHWLRRLLWFMFVAASTATLLNYVVDFYAVYNTHPYKTINRLERVKLLPLPGISICNTLFKKSKIRNSEAIQEYLLPHVNSVIPAFGNFNVTKPPREDLDQLNYRLLDKIGMAKEELILKADIAGREIDTEHEFESTTSVLGHCITFNNGKGGAITLSYGQSLKMILNVTQAAYIALKEAGIYLLLHDPRDLPTPSTTHVAVATGFMTKLSLKATKLKFLPKPYKSYGDEYCIESTELPSGGLKWHKEYTWFACVEECLIRVAVEQCNCRANMTGFPGFLTQRICTDEEVENCISPSILTVYDSVLYQNDTCHCPQPCESMQYDVRTSMMRFPSKPVAEFLIKHGAVSSYQDLKDNYLSVQISFDRMMMHHTEHVPEISDGDIFGKLGGQMGLFVGASLLTLTEIVETLFLTLLVLGRSVLRHMRRWNVEANKLK